MSELPKNWAAPRLDEIGAPPDYGFTASADATAQGPLFLRITDIQNGLVDWSGVPRCSCENVGRFALAEGDIVVARTGATTGKSFQINRLPDQAVFASYLVRIRGSSELHPKWLKHYLDSPGYWEQIEENKSGSAQPGVNASKLAALVVPLAPRSEQNRIVAKLDSLRARSSRARQELDHIPKLIERYKQAILAKAFSGELIGLVPQTSHHPHPACWDLPSSWQWVRFDEAAEIASNLVPTSEVQQLPHIAPDNIGVGTGKLLAFKTVAEDGVKSPKHRFYPGQILYSKIRPYLRKAVLIDFNGVCSADMYPLNARSGVLPRYLYYWAFSPQLADFVVDHEGRTVLPKVNQVGLNQTPFPLPPEIDQEVIVSRLDAAFAWLDKIATEYARAEHLLPKLDQAILVKAFRGELVPQDPNDEPAAVLLERIRAERENGEPTRRRQARSA